MSPATAAAIEAETTTAHRSQYEPALLLDEIQPHPKNVRHNAAADQELVDSLLEQGLLEPLLVAPHPDAARGGYLLIAGHRRRDGLIKAGFTHAPAIIRHDLVDEADQVAAMLVENGRRAALTPLEEAEGYGQLRFDFGWKPGQIAKASGHAVETINRRLKLLKLDTKVQETLHQGQLSIDDALAIADFPAAEQNALSRSAGTTNFRYDLERAKIRRKRTAAFERQAKQLTEAGTPKRDLPAGLHGVWSLNDADHGMVPLSQTYSSDVDDHADCLAWIQLKDYYGAPEIEYVCTNVSGHDEQLDEQRRAARQAAEAERKAEEEHKQAIKIARNLRLDAILGTLKPGAKVDPALLAILRAVTPATIKDLGHTELGVYFEIQDVPGDQRWNPQTHNRKKADVELVETHLEQLLNGPAHKLLRAFVVTIAARIESGRVDYLDRGSYYLGTSAWDLYKRGDSLPWFALAETSGHTLTPVELELAAVARNEATADEADEDES